MNTPTRSITLIILLLSCTFVNAQHGQPFTASYEVAITGSHIFEKDKNGQLLKAINYVPGKGTHSILGEVSTVSIVKVDINSGENVIEFIETDSDGNSLFVTTKAISKDPTTWECHGAIMGGTGKYQTATGYYRAIGSSIDTASSWTANGMLYFTAEEDEVEAIREVIIGETSAYLESNNKVGRALRTYPHVNIINMPQDQAILTRIEADHENIYAQESFDLENIIRSDWDIQVRQNVAWATYTQTTDVLGSRVKTLETRILEKIQGSWKIALIQTMLDYANTHPPLHGPLTSLPKVYSVHDVELNQGVDPSVFESFFLKTIAPIYNNLEGQRIILTKADRGQRNTKYTAIVMFDDISDRDRIYPTEDAEDYGGEDIWGPQENWDKLQSMLSTNIGVLYSDYVMINSY